jgi:hypothetical protein
LRPEPRERSKGAESPRKFATRSDAGDQEAGFGAEVDRHLQGHHAPERGATDEARPAGVDASGEPSGVSAEGFPAARLDPGGSDEARQGGALETEQPFVRGHAGQQDDRWSISPQGLPPRVVHTLFASWRMHDLGPAFHPIPSLR